MSTNPKKPNRKFDPELIANAVKLVSIEGYKSEYVVAAPQYRAVANTAMGWKKRQPTQRDGSIAATRRRLGLATIAPFDIREMRHGGVMVWEIGQDATGESSLLRAIRSKSNAR